MRMLPRRAVSRVSLTCTCSKWRILHLSKVLEKVTVILFVNPLVSDIGNLELNIDYQEGST